MGWESIPSPIYLTDLELEALQKRPSFTHFLDNYKKIISSKEAELQHLYIEIGNLHANITKAKEEIDKHLNNGQYKELSSSGRYHHVHDKKKWAHKVKERQFEFVAPRFHGYVEGEHFGYWNHPFFYKAKGRAYVFKDNSIENYCKEIIDDSNSRTKQKLVAYSFLRLSELSDHFVAVEEQHQKARERCQAILRDAIVPALKQLDKSEIREVIKISGKMKLDKIEGGAVRHSYCRRPTYSLIPDLAKEAGIGIENRPKKQDVRQARS